MHSELIKLTIKMGKLIQMLLVAKDYAKLFTKGILAPDMLKIPQPNTFMPDHWSKPEFMSFKKNNDILMLDKYTDATVYGGMKIN